MFCIYIIDTSVKYPEYDYQVWMFLPWQGTAIPMGRRVGEWSWVGRIEKGKIKN